jgi:transcriptional regulator with XRE-family HTH domain
MATNYAGAVSSAARQMGARNGYRETRQPTVVDVARAAGVSPMTVSRVMNGGSSSEQSRRAVEQAVRELDYRPSEVARQLSAARGRRAVNDAGSLRNSAMPWQTYTDFWLNLLKPAS